MEVLKVIGNKPRMIDEYFENYSKKCIIRFNINQVEDGSWNYNQIVLFYDHLDYNHIVNKIISVEYPQDKMQAIINNYLLDPAEGKKEFDEMQSFRKMAKEQAKLILKYNTQKEIVQ